MNKLIKLGQKVIVQTSDGTRYQKDNVTKEEFFDLSENIEDEEYIKRFFIPAYDKFKEEEKTYNGFINSINATPFLRYEGDGIYWDEISPLSLPADFANEVCKAYSEHNEKALKAYRNFWILLSLNPNDTTRKNLWWFLNRHGLKLSSSGFFVAYRNVCKTDKKDKDGNSIYTDNHSHTFEIQIGKTVSMQREDCCMNNTVVCSSGLHVAGSKWLKENYCGDVGLVVLVNPYNVTSLPQESHHGKCRCCEYIPIDYAKFDDKKEVIPFDVETGFECPFAAQAIYEGIVTVEKDRYEIKAPTIPDVETNNSANVTNNLLELAKECLLNKDYKINGK